MGLFTMQEAAELIGIDYKRIWYAARVGDLKATQQVGRLRLFDDYGIAEMRRHFKLSPDDTQTDQTKK